MNSEDSIPTANAETSEARASDRDDIRRSREVAVIEARAVDLLADIIPLYTMKVAAALIPMSLSGLEKVLGKYKHRFPPRYRYAICGNRKIRSKIRLISSHEIHAIRDIILMGPGKYNLTPPTE